MSGGLAILSEYTKKSFCMNIMELYLIERVFDPAMETIRSREAEGQDAGWASFATFLTR